MTLWYMLALNIIQLLPLGEITLISISLLFIFFIMREILNINNEVGDDEHFKVQVLTDIINFYFATLIS